MAKRPTDKWRDQVAAEKAEVTAGLRAADEPHHVELYPESFVVATEQVLAAFETEVRGLDRPSDEEDNDVIRRGVEGLNAVDAAHDNCDYDTIDREDLCDFIDNVLSEAGIDLDALAARRGIDRSEITDEWRDW